MGHQGLLLHQPDDRRLPHAGALLTLHKLCALRPLRCQFTDLLFRLQIAKVDEQQYAAAQKGMLTEILEKGSPYGPVDRYIRIPTADSLSNICCCFLK